MSFWISEMKATLQSYQSDPSQDFSDDSEQILNDLKILEDHSFDDWLRMLPRALEESSSYSDTYDFSSKVTIEGEPLLSFMLSTFHSVYEDDQGFGGPIFPCKYLESYAVALLEIYDDNAECVLDITELVNGGWVNDFDDIAQVQAGETKFYENFCASLEELRSLNLTTENMTLQRMVYASVITVMEAYLSDTMKCHVLNRAAVKRRFVESHMA
jgi:hypothetical protein